jgi:hypothetical protein
VSERLRWLLPAGAVLASAALIGLVGLVVPVSSAGAVMVRASQTDSITMAVDSVSPSTPTPSSTLIPLTVTLTLTNTTDKAIANVHVEGERGEPIGNQSALDKSLTDANPTSSSGQLFKPNHPISVDLPPDGSITTSFVTATSILDDGTHICLCSAGGIYPLYFSAHVAGTNGVDQRLGLVTTYLPSFYEKPAPVHVSWLWPLIDRPHRLFASNVFTDDLLAGSLSAPDGRLSRALEVVEQVGNSVPLTLLIDPELLDEVEVMATEPYTVVTDGQSVPGTGRAAASAWLARLQAALIANPGLQVDLTPYADPDVESLSQHGLSWADSMPADMIPRVSDAIVGRPLDSTLAWPAAGAISQSTLETLQHSGVSTVVLNGTAVTPQTARNAVPAGLARLSANGTDVAAALTSAPIEKYASSAITIGGAGSAAMPDLIAELAVRAAQELTSEHTVVITAPRYVDASVSNAVQAIKDTSTSTFAEPIALRSAVSGRLLPTGRSQLAKVPAAAASLPEDIDAAAAQVGTALPELTSMLGQDTDEAAQTLLTSLPVALQRAESSAWRSKELGAIGSDYAQQLTAQIDTVTSGVRIVSPSSGSYTLASSSSPLPITVENDLSYPVRVRIKVRTVVNGLPGFSTKDIGTQLVDSKSKRTLHLPTTIDHSGRIKVEAILLTPNDVPLGAPVPLTVRSTALGVIGVIITIVAGVVLALALLVRLTRRLVKRRSGARKPSAEPTAAVSYERPPLDGSDQPPNVADVPGRLP